MPLGGAKKGSAPGVSPVRLALNVVAVLAWAGVSFALWYTWQLEPLDTKQQSITVEELEYPTIIACNAMRNFNLASRSHCEDEFGPWNKRGQDFPSKAEQKSEKCLPVGRIVFFEPQGPRYCLKYQAPDSWRVQKDEGLSILKSSIELLGPHGEEHFLPSQGLTVFVLSTADWERAVFRYNKQGGNGTDFLKLFNDITQASSIALASVQHHTNMVVHVQKRTMIGGHSAVRYHVTTSERPIHPQLLMALNAKTFHLCTLRIMFASNEIEETVEYDRFDSLKLLGFSAAVAIFLDLFVRFTCAALRLMLRQCCGKNANAIIRDFLEESAIEMEDLNEYGGDRDRL